MSVFVLVVWSGLAGNDDPTGYDESANARMPQNASDPTVQPFTATTGTWAVVCLDSWRFHRRLPVCGYRIRASGLKLGDLDHVGTVEGVDFEQIEAHHGRLGNLKHLGSEKLLEP